MLQLFKPKCRSILGVDIGPTFIKVIELSATEPDFIQGFGIEPLEISSVEGCLIKNPESIAKTLRNLLQKADLKSQFAILALPDSAVLTKVLEVPSSFKNHELDEYVFMEAESFLPYALDEIYFDYKIIQPASTDKAKQELIFVAAKKESVDIRKKVASLAGLKVKAIDIESFAMERIAAKFIFQEFTKPIALIDIRDCYINLIILDNLKLVFFRQNNFNPKESLALQITHALQFFYSSARFESLEHIFLSGLNFPATTLDEVEIPISVFNPSLVCSEPLLIAYGLALYEY